MRSGGRGFGFGVRDVSVGLGRGARGTQPAGRGHVVAPSRATVGDSRRVLVSPTLRRDAGRAWASRGAAAREAPVEREARQALSRMEEKLREASESEQRDGGLGDGEKPCKEAREAAEKTW